ncbi:hypothetical protein RSAG8_10136, partial [Rhizoctonia solani AG-8 WAC10335]
MGTFTAKIVPDSDSESPTLSVPNVPVNGFEKRFETGCNTIYARAQGMGKASWRT